MKLNGEVVDLNSNEFGVSIRREARDIVDSFGDDPAITLNALALVLALLIERMRPEVRDQVIDSLPDNIRANQGIMGTLQ
jgi:hypothetical protein